ncbi:ribonuclease Z [Candidatus Woesearchaeota archaeon]|nr:ribonuclease Z [Candidatus Woesearchaeota archaeon]
MQLTFLGTGAMVPTKDRNVQGIYLDYEGEGILIDCGEGTQRQMSIAGINRLKIKKILITHWHGDHVAGLIGLIQTLGNTDEPGTVRLYGPEGTKHYLGHLLNSCSFDLRLDLEVKEVIPKSDTPLIFYENDRYALQAVNLKHTIPCLGYAFVEKDQRKVNMAKAKKLGLKEGPLIGRLQRGEAVLHEQKRITPSMVTTTRHGKKIAFVLDTEPCAGMHTIAREADLLIAEATYESSLDEKAEQYKHLTAQIVAQVAGQEGVKKLILTHFSQRYKTAEDIEADAKKIFPETTCAHDFLQVKL